MATYTINDIDIKHLRSAAERLLTGEPIPTAVALEVGLLIDSICNLAESTEQLKESK